MVRIDSSRTRRPGVAVPVQPRTWTASTLVGEQPPPTRHAIRPWPTQAMRTAPPMRSALTRQPIFFRLSNPHSFDLRGTKYTILKHQR